MIATPTRITIDNMVARLRVAERCLHADAACSAVKESLVLNSEKSDAERRLLHKISKPDKEDSSAPRAKTIEDATRPTLLDSVLSALS